jgi:hypothetical protein
VDPYLKEELGRLFITVSVTHTTQENDMASGRNFQTHHRGDSCVDDFTLCHDLVCGHTVSPNSPNKEPCGPNCVRYSVLKATGINMAAFSQVSPQVFVCELCLKKFVTDNFARIASEYERLGWCLDMGEHDKVSFFTSHLVKRCVENNGMRQTRSLGDGGNQIPLEYDSSLTRTTDMWSYRDGDASKINEKGPLGMGGHHGHYEVGMHGTASAHGCDRSNVTAALDDLADRLLEVRVGESKDDLIDGLMSGLGGMSTE